MVVGMTGGGAMGNRRWLILGESGENIAADRHCEVDNVKVRLFSLLLLRMSELYRKECVLLHVRSWGLQWARFSPARMEGDGVGNFQRSWLPAFPYSDNARDVHDAYSTRSPLSLVSPHRLSSSSNKYYTGISLNADLWKV